MVWENSQTYTCLWPDATNDLEVLHNLLLEESKTQFDVDVERYNYHITSGMRRTLLDWILELTIHYHYQNDTFSLVANYVDRYLSVAHVPKSEFQLLGSACLFIAAKVKERSPPRLRDLCTLADDAFHADNIKEYELMVLNALSWRVNVPTPHIFLHQILARLPLSHANLKILRLNTELIINMMIMDFIRLSPSIIATCAIISAFAVAGSRPPSSVLDVINAIGIRSDTSMLYCKRVLAFYSRYCPPMQPIHSALPAKHVAQNEWKSQNCTGPTQHAYNHGVAPQYL